MSSAECCSDLLDYLRIDPIGQLPTRSLLGARSHLPRRITATAGAGWRTVVWRPRSADYPVAVQ